MVFKNKTRFFFFSGKGGVGKTTIAAATALRLSRKHKVLIVSTDPAHSIADSFEQKIGGKEKPIGKNLWGVEIDPADAVEQYKQKLAPKMEKMEMLKGLGLADAFDIAGMTPGIDEMAAFDRFLHYMTSNEYDYVVFDTAPTGHALRFLSLPDVMDSWLVKIIKLRAKFSGMINIAKKILPFGEPGKDDTNLGLEQLERMKARVEAAKKLLADKKRTEYNIVLIPQEMSIFESERALKTLHEYNIAVGSIFVNQLTPANGHCKFCQERRAGEQKRLGLIRQKFRGFKIRELELFGHEIKGERALEKVGQRLYGK